MTRLGLLICFFVFCATLARSAEDTTAASLPHISLPDIIATLPDGTSFTATEFRLILQAAAAAHPKRFNLPNRFMNAVLLRQQATDQKIAIPTLQEIDTRLRHEIALAGGERAFHARIRNAKLTLRDVKHAISEGILLERIVRARRTLPAGETIPDALARTVLEELRAQYRPVFHGLQPTPSARVATIGGRNITSDEVVTWLLERTNATILSPLLERTLDDRLLLSAAAKQGLPITGKTPLAIAQELFANALTKENLQTYAAGIARELDVIRVHHIFFAYDRTQGKCYRPGNVSHLQKIQARKRAEEFLLKIQNGEIRFGDAARQHSDCPSASANGNLGYLARSRDIVAHVPPQAYGLDSLRTAGRIRTPLAIGPDPAIRMTAESIRDSGISGLIETSTGISIVRRIETRHLSNLNAALPYLRQRRLSEKKSALLTTLRTGGAFKQFWSPEKR